MTRPWVVGVLLMAVLIMPLRLAYALPPCNPHQPWVQWQQFREQLISPEGRVIDRSDPRQITTSEGQSYAMFFALIDNDQALFRRLLRWTQSKLALGDLTARLPSWLWGQDSDGVWKVLDSNSASDADLWIAYTLLEAGRLWRQHSYTVLGTLLLQRIASEEVVAVPGFGYLMLPGSSGFIHQQDNEKVWRFNPSYLPPQLLTRIHGVLKTELWADLANNTTPFLIQTSPYGAAPDWVNWSGQWEAGAENQLSIGSYDAIRVYLWVGMLHPQAPGAARLQAHFQQVVDYLNPAALPPEKIDTLSGQTYGVGPVGFSAALLPLLRSTPFAVQQSRRVQQAAMEPINYYNGMLTLFGLGWHQERYRFDTQGRVIPAWTLCQ